METLLKPFIRESFVKHHVNLSGWRNTLRTLTFAMQNQNGHNGINQNENNQKPAYNFECSTAFMGKNASERP